MDEHGVILIEGLGCLKDEVVGEIFSRFGLGRASGLQQFECATKGGLHGGGSSRGELQVLDGKA